MRLNNAPVTSFVYEGNEYDIDMSFDVILDVFDMFEDKYLRDHEKAEIALEIMLGKTFQEEQVIDLWNHIHDNFIGKTEKQHARYDIGGNPMPDRPNEDKPVISLKQDAELIFASFQQAYGINLFQQQGKMHWNEFRALLNGLPEDTVMQRIVEIRSWKPSEGESKERKKHMGELQKIHEIKEVD